LTHILRLREVETPLATFFASGLLALGAKLGPFLWQLPPNFKYGPERLAAFFKLLPRDHEFAADLARNRDKKILPRACTNVLQNRPLRHALEIRHEGFRTPELKRSSRDVYIYFDNDAKVRAPGDALSLIERIRKLQSGSKD
jgi:uncharacterized protein YecE (DUF72 family)